MHGLLFVLVDILGGEINKITLTIVWDHKGKRGLINAYFVLLTLF